MNDIPTTYVNWHCPKCGLQHVIDRRSFSYPGKCPTCGDDHIRHDYPRLPVNTASCDSEPKQYDWCGGPKTIQVYLTAATGERIGTSMNPDYVPDCTDDPVTVARAVLDVCKTKYLLCSSTEKVAAVLAAMEKCQEQSDANARANRIHELRKRIVCDIVEYRSCIEAAELKKEDV